MNTTPRTTSALDVIELVEYLRVSFDKSGRERSNDEQHDANVVGLERMTGTALSSRPAYRDVGSASKFAKKRRAGFDALIADLQGDTFPEAGLVIWESSRGSRDTGEWLMLLDLLAKRGKVLVVTTHGRMYDPSNDRDWRTLMEDAIDSEYESRKTAGRVGRNMESSAKEGAVPGGQRAFGYTRSGVEFDPVEQPIVLELVERALGGESMRSLAADLNRRGVKTTAGNDWHPGVVRNMLRSPRIAGRRTHLGVDVAKGQWPGIVDETTHKRLVAVLASTPRASRGKSPWVLTGFLRCELCGASLVGNTDSRARHATRNGDGEPTRRYVCRKAPGYRGCGGVTIKALPVETLIGEMVEARLADVDRRRSTGPGDDAELAELAAIEAARIELADDYAAKTISKETRNADAAALDRRQREFEQRLAKKVTKASSLDLVAADRFVGRRWVELDVAEQRVFLGTLVETITIGPSATRGRQPFDRSRVIGLLPDGEPRIDWKV